MSKKKAAPKLSIKYPAGSQVLGFEVLQAQINEDFNFVGYNLKHQSSGARLAYICKDDPNNTFAVTFKTIPEDSSGVAHILEHIVLCGSKNYPLKDPFFSMIKRSLQNFMNAFTANDWTMYPFSTTNQVDFFNLLDVYLDAAFFPLLTKNSFLQEGWRLELADNNKLDSDFVAKGVVFNEMQGAMSTESSILAQQLISNLLNSGTYRYNSGGEPVDILKLNIQKLRSFHQKFYHPSNAWFYYYGQNDLEKICSVLQSKVFDHFDYQEANFVISSQPAHPSPIKVSVPYPQQSDKESGHQLVMSWLTTDIVDLPKLLLLQLLNSVLLNNAGAPLRKALLESKLGTNLADLSGLCDDLRNSFFSIGLKGVKKQDVSKVVPFIKEVLNNIVKQGIDQQLVETALHQMEFSVRSLESGGYSPGLRLLLDFVSPWLHGVNYLEVIDFSVRFKYLQQEMQKPQILENLIQDNLLNNNSYLLLELFPDNNYFQLQKKAINNKIMQLQRKSTMKDRLQVQKNAFALELLQNTKEDISRLPKVALTDIELIENDILPEHINRLPITGSKKEAFHLYQQPTNGLVHLYIEYPLFDLSLEDYSLIPSLAMILVGAGTKSTKYDQLAINTARFTGGIVANAEIKRKYNGRNSWTAELVISTTCLEKNLNSALNIVKEIILELSFNDKKRIHELLQQRAVNLYNNVLQRGHSYAGSAAMKHLNEMALIEDSWYGLHQVLLAKKLAGIEDVSELCSKLQQMAISIFSNKPNFVAIGRPEINSKLKTAIKKFAKDISPKKSKVKKVVKKDLLLEGSNEVWLTLTPVSYVAKAYSVDNLLGAHSPALMVLSYLLRGEYLHPKVREKGGAYGAMVGYDSQKGLMLMLSYRDPNLNATWQTFDDALQWAAEGRFSGEELEAAILQTFASLDKPLTPKQLALKNYNRYCKGLEPEFWLKYRKKIIALTPEKVIAAVRNWRKFDSYRAVISSAEIWDNQAQHVPAASYSVSKF